MLVCLLASGESISKAGVSVKGSAHLIQEISGIVRFTTRGAPALSGSHCPQEAEASDVRQSSATTQLLVLFVLFVLFAESREENHLADRLLVGEQHREFFDTAAPPARGWHAHL